MTFGEQRHIWSISLILFIFCYQSSSAQNTWSSSEFAGKGTSIINTSDGGYLVTGVSGNQMKSLKLDGDGGLVWEVGGGVGNPHTIGRQVIERTSTNYYILTEVENTEAMIQLESFSLSGELQWSNVYSFTSSGIIGMRIATDSTISVMGTSYNEDISSQDLYLLRTSMQGDSLGITFFGSTEYGNINCGWCGDFLTLEDSSYLYVGSIYVYDPWGMDFPSDIRVMKFMSDGLILWDRIYDFGFWELVSSVTSSHSGGFVAVGYAGDREEPRSGLAFEIDQEGELVWSNIDSSNSVSEYRSIQKVPWGGYILAGNHFIENNWDAWAVRLNDVGNTVWSETYGDNFYQFANEIAVTQDSCMIFAGETYTNINGNQFWIVKMDTLGRTSPPTLSMEDTGVSYISSRVQLFDLKVSPNPTNSNVRISFQSQMDGNARVEIFDLMGRSHSMSKNLKIYKGKNLIYLSECIDHMDLSSGLYILNVSIDHYNQATKFVYSK